MAMIGLAGGIGGRRPGRALATAAARPASPESRVAGRPRRLRAVPPAAGALGLRDVARGGAGLVAGARYLARLEAEVRRELAVPHVFLFSSGRAALAVLLRALHELSGRTEVVVPAYTCFSVPAAVVRAGLVVVPCDVDPERFDFNPRALARAVTGRTLCVIPTHLLGATADVTAIAPLARARGAFVVEDAAQGLGGRRDGRPLGTLGDAGVFSFDRGKLVTCGSGGMVVTASARIAAALGAGWRAAGAPGVAAAVGDVLRALGLAVFLRPWLHWLPAAMPWLELGRTVYDPAFPIRRMSGAKAAMLAGWPARVAAERALRAEAADDYRRRGAALAGDGGAAPAVRIPLLAPDRPSRDALVRAGRRRGLGIAPLYPTGIDEIPALRAGGPAACPGAAAIAARLLTLPGHRFASAPVRAEIGRLVAAVLGDERAAPPAPAGGVEAGA
jgi:perosamine synthetase